MPVQRSLATVLNQFEPVAYETAGVVRWRVDVNFKMDDGIPCRIQKRGFLTRGEALVFVEREVTAIKLGLKRPNEPKPEKAAKLSTAEALEHMLDWWQTTGRWKVSTVSVARSNVKHHVLPVLGNIMWKDITQRQIDDFVALASKVKNPRFLYVLKSALRDSRRAGLTPPAVELDLPSMQTEQRNDFITVDELERICAKATPLYAACFRFLFFSGIRVGEFTALQWDDFDFRHQAETMTIRRNVYHITGGPVVQTPKSGKSRTLPLNFHAVQALTEIAAIRFPGRGVYADPSAPLAERLVVAGEGKDIYLAASRIRHALAVACKKARMRHVTCHTMRHAFCSNLVMNGVDLLTIGRLAGHASIQATQRYSHLAEEGIRSASGKLDTLARRHKKSKS